MITAALKQQNCRAEIFPNRKGVRYSVKRLLIVEDEKMIRQGAAGNGATLSGGNW